MNDPARPSTWQRHTPSLCRGCMALCCTLPVEATIDDLIRLGVVSESDRMTSPRKLTRNLTSQGIVRNYRAKGGLYTLAQKPSGDCIWLGPDRLCTVYDKRPDVCRRFPSIGPRPGYCPARRIPRAQSPAPTGR